jgi:outer membrane protein
MTLTLAEAEQMALQNNPQISAAKYNAEAVKQTPLEVHATLMPNLSGAVTGVVADSGARIAAGALNNPVLYNRFATGLALSQMVTDFGRTRNLEESANFKAQSAEQATQTAQNNILIATARAYFSVLRSKAVLRVAQQTVDARKLVSDQVTALANNNLKSTLDVSFANVNLSDSQLLLAQAQNNVKAAEAELSAALGLPGTTEYNLRDEPVPPDYSKDVNTWIDQAMKDRPELKDLRLQQQAADRFAKAEHALKYPTVSVVGAAGLVPASESAVKSRYGGVGVNLSIPIFNGGLFKYRQSEAELKAMAANENVNDLANRITRDVKVAFLNVQTAQERVGLTAQMLQRAQLALDLARGRYDLGLSSIVELSQAQLNLTAAQIDSAAAQYDYQTMRAILDYQSGQLH